MRITACMIWSIGVLFLLSTVWAADYLVNIPPELKLHLHVPQKRTVPGVPVLSLATWSNTGPDTITMKDVEVFWNTQVFVRNPDNNMFRAGSTYVVGVSNGSPGTIRSGETQPYEIVIFYNHDRSDADAPEVDRIAFPVPGNYAVQARQEAYGGASSEWIKIEVTRPEGQDRQAHEYMREHGGFHLLYGMHMGIDGGDRSMINSAYELIRRFPDSQAASHLRYRAAQALVMATSLHDVSESDRTALYHEAWKVLSQIKTDNLLLQANTLLSQLHLAPNMLTDLTDDELLAMNRRRIALMKEMPPAVKNWFLGEIRDRRLHILPVCD